MTATSKHLRTFVVFAVLLAVTAGSLTAQTEKKRRRAHRIFAAQTGPDEVTLAWDEVPGATEYRIYLASPNSADPPSPASRPWTVFSASGRRAIVSGIQRQSGGAHLMAMKGRQVLFQGKFDAVTRAPLARVTAPAAVSAQETGETEVTVSWDAVPGATAYRLGRAVGGEGLSMLCDLCPPEAVFVDTAATPGLDHLYTVEAIFPTGLSDRTISDPITVGAAQLAAASGAVASKPMASGTPVAVTDANDSNAGASAGTATPGAGAGGTATPTTGTPTVTCPPGTTPITAMPKTGTPITTKPMASGMPVAGTEADNTNAGASSGTNPAGTTTTGTTPPGCIPTGTTPTYTPPGQPVGTLPTGTTPTYTPPGQPTGTTSTYTPPGQPAGTTPTYTPPGQPASTLPATSTPITVTPTSPATPVEQIATLVQRIGDRLTYLLGSVAAGGTMVHTATPVTSGTTSPVTTDQVASWVGGIKTNLAELLGSISAGSATTHAASPVSTSTTSATTTDPLIGLALAIRDKVANLLGAVGGGSSLASMTSAGEASQFAALLDAIRTDVTELMGAVGVNTSLGGMAPSTGTTVHASTPIGASTPATATPATATPATATPATGGAATACRLDYQRADNMWAAFGRPDGQLGTESISLAPGQNRVFVTDWKYEKQKNDGTNYYGSHLRTATNRTARPVRLQLRSTTLTGLVIFVRTGNDTFWIRLDPNASKQFQADLMEVFCEN